VSFQVMARHRHNKLQVDPSLQAQILVRIWITKLLYDPLYILCLVALRVIRSA
jgi:hypothetical protein